MSFHVGQVVVCVEVDYFSSAALALPVKGHVYTVREIYAASLNGPQLHLAEIANPVGSFHDGDGEPWFAARRFRPVDEARLAIFREMLAPAPKTTVDA